MLLRFCVGNIVYCLVDMVKHLLYGIQLLLFNLFVFSLEHLELFIGLWSSLFESFVFKITSYTSLLTESKACVGLFL